MGIDRRRAQADFNMRIDNYTKIYDPMSTDLDGNASFIKLIDVGRRKIALNFDHFISSHANFPDS